MAQIGKGFPAAPQGPLGFSNGFKALLPLPGQEILDKGACASFSSRAVQPTRTSR